MPLPIRHILGARKRRLQIKKIPHAHNTPRLNLGNVDAVSKPDVETTATWLYLSNGNLLYLA